MTNFDNYDFKTIFLKLWQMLQ